MRVSRVRVPLGLVHRAFGRDEGDAPSNKKRAAILIGSNEPYPYSFPCPAAKLDSQTGNIQKEGLISLVKVRGGLGG